MSNDLATQALDNPERSRDGMSMDGMTPAHAKPSRRDHLWVLVIIAGFALFDVWESWTQVGNKSGFAHGTGWTLTVIVEVYAAYALFGWFGAPGQRSRRFAMWSAFGVLVLSLIGQGSSVLAAQAVPPLWLKVFVKDLPVVVLALIALLVHVRRLDRDEAAAAERAAQEAAQATGQGAAEASELAALRDELEAAQEALATAQSERKDAQRTTQEATAKAEVTERKLAAARARTARTEKGANAPRSKGAETRATEVPNDVDAQAEALSILANEPGISGAKLGPRVGMSARWGQLFLKGLTTAAADSEGGES